MSLNIEVKDTVFDPDQAKTGPQSVHVRMQEGKPLYKVWLYLSGLDLPYVQSVTYTLHSTFRNPIRKVKRGLSNQNCELVIWTWSLFEVKAIIEDKSNRRYEINHYLSYDKELKRPNIKYISAEAPPSLALL